MSAFMIFHSTVKDPDNFKAYAKSVAATLQPFGGSVLTKGKAEKVFVGKHTHQTVGVLSFPSLEKAHGWYESESYQSLISVRDAAADMLVISYVQPAA